MPATERILPADLVETIEDIVVEDYVSSTVISADRDTSYNQYLSNLQTTISPRRDQSPLNTGSAPAFLEREVVSPVGPNRVTNTFGIPPRYQDEIARPNMNIPDRSGAAGVYWTIEKRRIALNYAERGVGHPSDLESWFYLTLPEAVTEPTGPQGPGIIIINQTFPDYLAATDLFSDDQIGKIGNYQGYILSLIHI